MHVWNTIQFSEVNFLQKVDRGDLTKFEKQANFKNS